MDALSHRPSTGAGLFEAAVMAAQSRAYWRQAAEVGSLVFSRRQCLLRARAGEARVVDLAIQAEMQCRLERPAS